MVWIHGGGFTEGSSKAYDPHSMVVENDVIVVTLHYRLGALGWLSSGDSVLPGNLGLQDQLLALQWVKDNIAQFGGDPDDVTLFGLSAGGVSVSALTLSPKAKGLFSKAIIQSAPLIGLQDNPRKVFYDIAKGLGCYKWFYFPGLSQRYHESILQCMMGLDATQLTYEMQGTGGVQNLLRNNLYGDGGLSPVVDGDIIPREPVDLLNDERYLKENGVLDRSYVLGFTNNDGMLLINILSFIPGRLYLRLAEPANVASQIRSMADALLDTAPTTDVLNVIDFVYTYPRQADGSIPLQKVVDIASDGLFVLPSIAFARAVADKAPVYLYLFDHYPELKDTSFPLSGTNHAFDQFYLFDYPKQLSDQLSFYAKVYTPESEPLLSVYRGVLSSFAKTGAPTFQTNPASATSPVASWPRYDMEKQEYLAISTKPEVRRQVYAERVALWTEYLPKVEMSKSFGWGSGRPAYI